MKYYTGIGSRETPPDILDIMSDIAAELARHKFILRSGAADGADRAFEKFVENGLKEICLPWHGFQGRGRDCIFLDYDSLEWNSAFTLAERFHPAWNRLSEGSKKLIARDGFQVLGLDLKTPSAFVICWTKGGKGGGGTGQAIRIARSYSIPVYDLARPFKLQDLLSELLKVN